MKNPNKAARRTIIREWMALPRDKRSSKTQAAAFAEKAAERHALRGHGDSAERVMRWLSSRISAS